MASTRSVVAALGPAEPLRTIDTRPLDTPASAATSAIVGRRRPAGAAEAPPSMPVTIAGGSRSRWAHLSGQTIDTVAPSGASWRSRLEPVQKDRARIPRGALMPHGHIGVAVIGAGMAG